MKKFLSILCTLALINLAALPVFCSQNSAFSNNELIQDTFIEKTLSKNLTIKPANDFIIEDIFVGQTLDKNLSIKEYQYKNIADDFAENNKNKNPKRKKIIIRETLPKTDRIIALNNIPRIFDTENLTPVLIKTANTISTKGKFLEGDYVFFETAEGVKINNIYYKKGTPVQARIETVSQNKIRGVPSDLIVGNFSIDNIPLYGEISKTGANRSLWLYPAICATSWLFGAGVLLAPIRGGHARIRTGEIYTVYAKKD